MRHVWIWTTAAFLGVIAVTTEPSAAPSVSGEWETEVSAECIERCTDERRALSVELESALALEVDYDALTLTWDTLWGLPGLLEATWEAGVDLGVPRLAASLTVTSPIDDDQRIPPGTPLPVRSRLETEFPLEGVELTLGVIHDDVRFEDRDASMPRYGRVEQRFRAGAVVNLEGETTQGAELSAETGFCFDPDARFDLPVGSLSGEVCEAGLLNWSRSILEITDWTLASSLSLTGNGELNCEPSDAEPSFACEWEAEFNAAFPDAGLDDVSVELDYDAIYPHRALDEITVELAHQANVEAELTLNGALQWEELDVEVERAIHRQETVLFGSMDGTYERRVGVTDVDLEGGLERGPLELTVEVAWERAGRRLHVDELSADGEVQFGGMTLESGVDVDPDGLDEITATGTVAF